MATIFDELAIGDFALKNRFIMAPLTRMRSKQPGNIPWELNAEYYRQRASAGLIMSEATQISQRGQGYPGTPGIHSPKQVEGWKEVTSAAHNAGGKIFLQLWHVGRISHRSHQPNGALPVAPSAIKPSGGTYSPDWEEVPFEMPRALDTAEIPLESAQQVIQGGLADAVAFGRLFIANPDLPERVRRGAALNRYDRSTFYGGDAKGYTDYPALVA